MYYIVMYKQESIILMKFPKHEAALHLTHNEHKSWYKTVAECIEYGYFTDTDFINEEQKQKAIATNECWALQWYPDTPVGCCILYAADLKELLKAANAPH